MVGSGYLLRDGLVLTAGHVVDVAGEQDCEVRPLGEEQWLKAQVAWRGTGDCDVALLRVLASAGAMRPMQPAVLGRVVGHERVEARAVGFAAAQARPDGTRDTEDLRGEVVPLSARKSGRLTISIDGSVPEVVNGHSLWEGMSGAALFCGGLLVGVVIVAPQHFGGDRLEAISLTAIASDAAFRMALTGEGSEPVALLAVEAAGLLQDPYAVPVAQPGATVGDRSASGSVLLRADLAVVPFRSRAGVLAELEAWCTGGAGLAVSLLLGAGGTGKSRLAAQLCERRQAAGAVAGFLAASGEIDRVTGLIGAGELLIVVDEAHTRHDEVAALLRALAGAAARAPVRMLLVARGAGDWWSTQLPGVLEDDLEATLAVEAARVRELGPVEESAEGRAEVFLDAVDAFAVWQGRAVPVDLAVPDLAGPGFDAILWVHLAALSAVDRETDLLTGSVVRGDLIDYALRRERAYWTRTARTRGLNVDAIALERAVAVATIVLAGGEDEAAAALLAVPDLAESPQHVRPVARWLHELYPLASVGSGGADTNAAGWLPALTPEPLGEALIARVVGDIPELPTRLLERATPVQTQVALTALTEAARSYRAVRAPTARRSRGRAPHGDWKPNPRLEGP
jgi:Trypsin-like peptidase domain